MAEPGDASAHEHHRPAKGQHVPATQQDITRPDGSVLGWVETIEQPASGRRPLRLKARKQALDLLYAADLRGAGVEEVAADLAADSEAALRPFASELVASVERHGADIDRRLAAALPADWSLARMPRIDRCLARLAVAELLSGSAAPEVVVEQAVTLAGELSTDESAAFLNGLLSSVLRVL